MCFSPYSDLMQHYYGNLVRECVARRRRELAAVDTPEKALDYVRLARERIRNAFGPLPERRVADVAVHGLDVRHLPLTFKNLPAGRIGEKVEIDETVFGVRFREVVDEVGADEAGAARDEKGFLKHAKESDGTGP